MVLCVGAVATLPFFGATFLPEFREGHYLIHMSAVPGTSLEESVRLGKLVSARLLTDPRVRLVAQRAGRAELSEDTWGTHYTEFEVDLVPLTGRAAETVQDDLRRMLEGIPGRQLRDPRLPGRADRGDADRLDGAGGGEALRRRPRQPRRRRRGAWPRRSARVRGATDVQYDPPPVAPEVTVRLRPFDLASVGLRPDEVLEAVETATRGATVAQVFDGSRTTDVVVILDSASRRRPGAAAAHSAHAA